MPPELPAVRLRHLGMRSYHPVWREMRTFTDSRDAGTADEFWIVEHRPVFTLGQAGRREHVLAAGSIPVVHSDRGGQVTYHGPGQVVLYTLVDLKRLRSGVRSMVEQLESAVMAVLDAHGVPGERRQGAPGVYVRGAKIAALGLRVRNGCTYHGIALNVDMDLEPFSRINPCGFQGMAVTSLGACGVSLGVVQAGEALAGELSAGLGLSLCSEDSGGRSARSGRAVSAR